MSDSFAAPWTVAHQAPLSSGFPRQEYWSGLPFSSPEGLPKPGVGSETSALAGNASPLNLGFGYLQGFPGVSDGKESACAGDSGLIPGSGRCPGEGNDNPLQYSRLENSMGRGVWQATVHGRVRGAVS